MRLGSEAESLRVQLWHENGATVSVLTPHEQVIRTFAVEGDDEPYPEPLGQLTG